MGGVSTRPSAVRWWRSLYWRLGVGFVVFVIGISLAQSLIQTYRARWDDQDVRRSPNAAAMAIAFVLAERLERGEEPDVPRLQREQFPLWTRLYVVRRDGRVQGANDTPLDPDIIASARQALDPTPTPGQAIARPSGPVVIAPLRVRGELEGLVVLPPPKDFVSFEIRKFFSYPGFLVLLAATALAAFVIVRPARRKLAALEATAERIRLGDLQARAPEHGGDEIARVASAFNRMGEEIAARDEALRRVDRLRRQMLADVSHELKTPLTAMRGFIETLQMPDVDLEPWRRDRYFATLLHETLRLERIVADLLDVARLEGGVADLESQVFDTRRLCEQVVRRHEDAAAARGVRLAIEVAADADQAIGDPHRLEQALENLVGNAMRHVPDGGDVVMRAAVAPGRVCLSVCDTGPGIPPEHLPHVFDRFYKADPSRAATREGSGLGLSIVKAVVERHGGHVHVESRPGRTEFSLVLPRDPSD
jgi:signal transduction histidine kinase